MEFKEFKIEDLFEYKTGDVDLQKTDLTETGEWVVTAGTTNHGLLGKTTKTAKIISKNTITIDMFGYAFYRNFDYKMVTHARVFAIIPKIKCNERIGLFLTGSLAYLKKLFSYQNMCSFSKIKDLTIQLPVTPSGEIDFDYMEQYVEKIEKQYVEKIALMLKASGLDNYQLTEEEKAILKEEKEKKEFKIEELFNVESSKKIFHANNVVIKNCPEKDFYPYVVRSAQNNGVVGYINEKKEYLNPKNTLSFAQDTFVVFYQNQDYFTGNKVKILNPKIKFNQNIGLFITSVFNVLLKNYSWGVGSTTETIKNYKIQLPITSTGEIDFDYMEKYISAIIKTKIKNVVLEINKKLELYKQTQN